MGQCGSVNVPDGPSQGSVGPSMTTTLHRHPLVYVQCAYPGGKFYCDRCWKIGRRGYNCPLCKFDLCNECARVVSIGSNDLVPVLTNTRGIPMHQSFDNAHKWKLVYYCGKVVGQQGYHNACGRCDGRCGPSNGCQCVWCHEASDIPLAAAVEEFQTGMIPVAMAVGNQRMT